MEMFDEFLYSLGEGIAGPQLGALAPECQLRGVGPSTPQKKLFSLFMKCTTYI